MLPESILLYKRGITDQTVRIVTKIPRPFFINGILTHFLFPVNPFVVSTTVSVLLHHVLHCRCIPFILCVLLA